MKTCPTCYRSYSDDTLAFCLDDGTPLSLNNSEATRIIPPGGVAPDPTMVSRSTPLQQPRGQTFLSHVITANDRKSNPLVYVVIALLALIAGGGLVAVLIFGSRLASRNETANLPANRQPELVNQQKHDLQNQQAELERERQRLEDERKKLESQKSKPVETTAPSVDSTARITFRRGNVQEAISGVVARSKSYVLKAKAGQYLSATVTSNGCVIFNSGSSSMNFVTANGDNWITVVNNCGGQAPFNSPEDIR